MKIQARLLGLQSYSLLLRDMRHFTEVRSDRTADEIWVVEHPPVYTRGQRESGSDDETIVVPGMGPVPVVASDRGGLITYHGPGQMIFYVFIDLKRSGVGVRRLVAALEQAIIDLLRGYGIDGSRIEGAPGVYVNNAKIASLGLRIRRGATYHGLSLNVDMDMAPFGQIDPCGVPDQPMTQLRTLGVSDSFELIADKVCRGLSERLGYTVYIEIRQPRSDDDSLDDGVDKKSGWPRRQKGGSKGDSGVKKAGAAASENDAVDDDGSNGPRSAEPGVIATPVGSNLLSHLTTVSESTPSTNDAQSHSSASPTNDIRFESESDSDQDKKGQRLSSIIDEQVQVVETQVVASDDGGRLQQPVIEEQNHAEPATAANRPVSHHRVEKKSDATQDRDEDLGFGAPSNLHELTKNPNSNE